MRPAATSALLLALAAAPALPSAQAFDGTQGVDTFTGPVAAPGRIVGLGGAFVAVAEGLGGAAVNPAAVAHRSPRLARGWDWDWLLTWYVPQPEDVGRQDLGNDGRLDAGLSGVGNGEIGISLQLGRFGTAVWGRGWNLTAPRDGLGSVDLEVAEASLAGGASLRDDAVVFGASVTSVSGVVRVEAPGAVPAAVEYAGSTVRFGWLLRPRGLPWRLGLAVDGGARAKPVGDRAAVPVATPAEFVFPWIVSLGGARWVGPNAARINEPPAFERDRHPEWGAGPAWEASRREPVLVTAQVDLVGPAGHSVALETALVPPERAIASGTGPSLVVRAGAEWEAVPRALRVRGGAYVEPSRTGTSPRGHATFGLEVRVPAPLRDLQLGLSGDVAERFANVSLSLGFWSSFGPAPPGGDAAPSAP